MRPRTVGRHALLAGVLAVVWSCADRSPLGVPVSEPSAASLELLGGLLQCTPLPADSVTQTIGPWGGTIEVGPHRLWVPAGALSAPVSITAVAPSDTVNQVRFTPEGLVFENDAWLTMSYANCGLLSALIPKQIVHSTPDLLEVLEILQSFDNSFTRRVTGRLEHFSTYAVAW